MKPVALDTIDSHVHLRDPENYPESERAYSQFGVKSALQDLEMGGVLMAHAMPNLKVPLTTYESFKKCVVAIKDYPAYGGIYFCYNGTNMRELMKCYADPEVQKHLVGVKIYPATQEGGNATTSFSAHQDMYDFSLEKNSQLDQIAQFCVQTNLSLTIHCEDPEEKAKILERGAYGKEDDNTEPNFVQNIAIPLCKKYPELKFIVAHVSHRDTIGALEEAWDEGATNLYAEITPHHLLLSTTEIREKLGEDAVFGFCHPFVKISGSHRNTIALALLESKHQGQILYGSDHAPHPEEVKRGKKVIGGIPNHQGVQIIAAWFRARGLSLSDPRVQAYFHGNAEKVFRHVPGYIDRFRKKAQSVLFTPSEFQENGVSIPSRIHDGAVVNPWERLITEDIKANWVVPKKAA